MEKIKAITFDVQGTCVDFVAPLLRAGTLINKQKGLTIDWEHFSALWRQLYRKVLDEIIAGHRPWIRVDRIYRQSLDELLSQQQLTSHFSTKECDELSTLWSHLEPWPDSIEGLSRLREKFITATLSNTGMATMVSLVKQAKLPFDVILTAELAQDYKPSKKVYQLAVDYLGFLPEEILMVACHKYDLKAAHDFGMRTAFVKRPFELGKSSEVDLIQEPWFDFYVENFIKLADALHV